MSLCSALLGAARCVGVALLAGCMASSMVARDGMLWQRDGRFGVPDLSAEGWTRVEVDDAEVAFYRPSEGVIAVRSRCARKLPSVGWLSRSLWLGVPREQPERRERTLAERAALDTSATSDGVRVRTVVVRDGSCGIDLAHVAAPGAAPGDAFDRFLERVRLGEAP